MLYEFREVCATIVGSYELRAGEVRKVNLTYTSVGLDDHVRRGSFVDIVACAIVDARARGPHFNNVFRPCRRRRSRQEYRRPSSPTDRFRFSAIASASTDLIAITFVRLFPLPNRRPSPGSMSHA